MALMLIGTKEAYDLIDRKGTLRFLLSLKDKNIKGAIRMEPNGERDMRSVYCAIAVAKILNILSPELAENVSDYIASA